LLGYSSALVLTLGNERNFNCCARRFDRTPNSFDENGFGALVSFDAQIYSKAVCGSTPKMPPVNKSAVIARQS
jgi:hypothetical protein